jgi:hypothetical protein
MGGHSSEFVALKNIRTEENLLSGIRPFLGSLPSLLIGNKRRFYTFGQSLRGRIRFVKFTDMRATRRGHRGIVTFHNRVARMYRMRSQADAQRP